MKKTIFYKEYQAFNNVREIFMHCVENYPDDIAYSYKEGKEWKQKTFKEAWEDVNRLSDHFIKEGLSGKTISLIGPTTYTWIVSFYAVMNIGSVAVSLDKGLRDEDLAEKIQFTDSDAFIYDSEYETLIKHCDSEIRAISMESVKKEISNSENSAELPEMDIDSDKTALIIFTSGTTSIGKAVMLSQKNILAPAPVGSIAPYFINGTFLMLMPLSHSFGITQLFWALYCGANFVINDSVKNMLENMKLFKPTEVTVIPMIVEMVYNNIIKSLKAKNKLKTVTTMRKVCRVLRKFGIDIRRKVFKDIIDVFGGELVDMPVGGAYLNPERIKFFDDIGINLVQGYGLTETSAIVSANARGLGYKKFDSVGYVFPYNEVRIQDGEIQVKGRNVMKGYYKNEEATKAAFDGEWFKTGDLGRLDDEGYLYITGRIKNLIILPNGENVSPEILENKIGKIEYVSEVVVKELDGKICAEIFMNKNIDMDSEEEERNLGERITELNKTLPSHHNIQKIVIRNTEFEKNSTNKIIRK